MNMSISWQMHTMNMHTHAHTHVPICTLHALQEAEHRDRLQQEGAAHARALEAEAAQHTARLQRQEQDAWVRRQQQDAEAGEKLGRWKAEVQAELEGREAEHKVGPARGQGWVCVEQSGARGGGCMTRVVLGFGVGA